MTIILEALFPVFLLIFLGYLFKRLQFPHPNFWAQADRFTYYILFPSLLIYKLSAASLGQIESFSFAALSLFIILLFTALLIPLNRWLFKFDGAAFTSIYQGSIRFNTYVFLALTASLFGDEGLVLAALIVSLFIPSANVLCISIFSLYTSKQSPTPLGFAKSILKNPLIAACVIGMGLNYTGIKLWQPLENSLAILSAAALPIGLLAVGVGLKIRQMQATTKALLVSSAFKLVLFPLLTWGLGRAIGLDTFSLHILVLFSAIPTASTAYVMAKELGGDAQLMSSIITFQTLLSMLSLTLIVFWLI